MNKLYGHITDLTNEKNLSLVKIDVEGIPMTAIMIGKPGKVKYLQCGNAIELLFNESEVSIGKNTNGKISLANQLECIIDNLNEGKIFTKINLLFKDIKLTSLITSGSVKRLDLKKGDKVMAFIKTNEVFLKEPEREEENGH